MSCQAWDARYNIGTLIALFLRKASPPGNPHPRAAPTPIAGHSQHRSMRFAILGSNPPRSLVRMLRITDPTPPPLWMDTHDAPLAGG